MPVSTDGEHTTIHGGLVKLEITGNDGHRAKLPLINHTANTRKYLSGLGLACFFGFPDCLFKDNTVSPIFFRGIETLIGALYQFGLFFAFSVLSNTK